MRINNWNMVIAAVHHTWRQLSARHSDVPAALSRKRGLDNQSLATVRSVSKEEPPIGNGASLGAVDSNWEAIGVGHLLSGDPSTKPGTSARVM